MAKESILLVEDEEIVRRSLMRVLHRAGYQVEGVPSGEEGLEKLKSRDYNLLLIDIKMPHMGGIEFLEEARKSTQAAAVFITGYGTLANAISALELGAQGLALKPIYPEQLLQTVGEVLDRTRTCWEEQRLRAYSPVIQLSRTLLGQGDPEEVLRVFMATLKARLSVDQVALFLRAEAGRLVLVSSQGFPGGLLTPSEPALERLEAEVYRLGDVLTAGGDCLSWPELQPISSDSASIICLPLIYRAQLLGLILLGQRSGGRTFLRSDVEFVWILSSLLAPAIQGSRFSPSLRG
ncbi:MAG: response regulator [Dehalococcoidia bacterium]